MDQASAVSTLLGGLAEYRRAEAAYVDGAWAKELPGLLLVSLGLPPPWANVAQVTGPVPDPAITLREAWSLFSQAGRPMSVQLVEGRDDALADEALAIGLDAGRSLIGLVRSPAARPFAMPRELTIVRAGASSLDEVLDVQAAAFETDRDLMGRLHPPAALDEPRLTFYAGAVDDALVATAECFVHGDAAGLSGICTLDRARGHGIGTALTQHAIAKSGASVAWLLADALVAPFYERIGFVPVCTLRSYVPS